MAQDAVMFSMRIPRWLKRALDLAAERDDRSTASLMQVIAKHWLDGETYQPSFDRGSIPRREVDRIRADLRPAPGRPRENRKPRCYTGNAEAVVGPFLNGKNRLSISEIVQATSWTDERVLRELLIKKGWKEYQDADSNRVWVDLNA